MTEWRLAARACSKQYCLTTPQAWELYCVSKPEWRNPNPDIYRDCSLDFLVLLYQDKRTRIKCKSYICCILILHSLYHIPPHTSTFFQRCPQGEAGFVWRFLPGTSSLATILQLLRSWGLNYSLGEWQVKPFPLLLKESLSRIAGGREVDPNPLCHLPPHTNNLFLRSPQGETAIHTASCREFTPTVIQLLHFQD